MPKKPVNEPADAGPPNEGNRFKPGRSGNPAGRPRGSRAPLYAELDAAAAEALPDIVAALVGAAKTGDTRAAELLMRRAWPERKSRAVSIALPETSGADGVARSMEVVIAAMADGTLTPDEAAQVGSVLELHRRAIATEDHEQRLRVLEEGKV